MSGQMQSQSGDGTLSRGMELLTKSLKTVFTILAAVIIVLLIWFLTCGGSFIVDSTTESVIVLKFGKFHGEYTEGWHWFLPYPVTKIVRIPTRKETVVSKTFLPVNAAKLRDPNSRTLMGNEAGETLMPGMDGYALLSDNSIMHSEWVLTYRVGEPSKFYRNCMSRESTGLPGAEDNYMTQDSETVKLDAASAFLRAMLDGAVIEAGTMLTIDGTYYDPDKYLRTVRTLLEQRIRKMDIGLVMENLSLSHVAPPLKTQAAFQAFLLAKTMAEREVEAARTYAVEQENQALAKYEKLVSDGRLQKQRTISATSADAAYFSSILEVYRQNPQATIVSLYSTTLAKSLAPVREKYVVSTDKESKSEVRIHINREMEKQNAGPAGETKETK